MIAQLPRTSPNLLPLVGLLINLIACGLLVDDEPEPTSTLPEATVQDVFGVACDPPGGSTSMDLGVNPAGQLSLRLAGLEPRERPVILYSASADDEQVQGEWEARRDIGPNGRLNEQIKPEDVGLSRQPMAITWEIAAIHAGGVMCGRVSMP